MVTQVGGPTLRRGNPTATLFRRDCDLLPDTSNPRDQKFTVCSSERPDWMPSCHETFGSSRSPTQNSDFRHTEQCLQLVDAQPVLISRVQIEPWLTAGSHQRFRLSPRTVLAHSARRRGSKRT